MVVSNFCNELWHFISDIVAWEFYILDDPLSRIPRYNSPFHIKTQQVEITWGKSFEFCLSICAVSHLSLFSYDLMNMSIQKSESFDLRHLHYMFYLSEKLVLYMSEMLDNVLHIWSQTNSMNFNENDCCLKCKFTVNQLDKNRKRPISSTCFSKLHITTKICRFNMA